jgi:hypothetical protein
MKRLRHLSFVVAVALTAGCGGGDESEGCTEEQIKAAEKRCQECLDSCPNCDDPLLACTASCRPCDE